MSRAKLYQYTSSVARYWSAFEYWQYRQLAMAFSVTDSKYPYQAKGKVSKRPRNAIDQDTYLHIRRASLSRRRVKGHVFLVAAFYIARQPLACQRIRLENGLTNSLVMQGDVEQRTQKVSERRQGKHPGSPCITTSVSKHDKKADDAHRSMATP
jgi:hypothetical protein